jgi:hypothetical protein
MRKPKMPSAHKIHEAAELRRFDRLEADMRRVAAEMNAAKAQRKEERREEEASESVQQAGKYVQ